MLPHTILHNRDPMARFTLYCTQAYTCIYYIYIVRFPLVFYNEPINRISDYPEAVIQLGQLLYNDDFIGEDSQTHCMVEVIRLTAVGKSLKEVLDITHSCHIFILAAVVNVITVCIQSPSNKLITQTDPE